MNKPHRELAMVFWPQSDKPGDLQPVYEYLEGVASSRCGVEHTTRGQKHGRIFIQWPVS